MIEKCGDEIERGDEIVESDASPRGLWSSVPLISDFPPSLRLGMQRLVDDNDNVFVPDVSVSGGVLDVVLVKLRLLVFHRISWAFVVIFRAPGMR